MKIYVIIVTFNSEKWIYRCIDSIFTSNIDVHIIVVDNSSTDNTVSIIENKFPNIELIRSQQNLGFGKGNNIALKRAYQDDADYVLLLNQDAYIEPDTIKKIVSVQQKNPEFGIISPFHYDYEGTNIEFYFSTIIGATDCPHFINDMHFKRLHDIYEIKFVHAACWLISKECLQTVGGFDPIFPHYSEDNDYINRATYHHFKTGIVPGALVYHVGTHSALKDIDKNFQLQLNFLILHLKNIKHGLPGLFLTQQKMLFDRFTSALLYRRWADLKMNIKLWFAIVKTVSTIQNSRKICTKKGAFLN